jgi:cholesterol transport system auxiliary component
MRHYLTIAALLPLSACISFGAKPPPSLLNITASSVLESKDARAIQSGQAIVINVPATPQAIATTRVVVSDGATSIAYIKNGLWVETPARLFQRLLAETVSAKTGKIVVDPRQVALEPSAVLGGQLLHFGIDAPTNSAVVTYDATLARDKGKQVMTRRFEARMPVNVIEAVPAGQALNRAANAVALDVAAWVGGQP